MRKRDTLPVLGSLLVLALALCLWEWAAKTGEIDIFFFSSPSLVWDTLLSQMSSGLLIRHLAVTLKEAALGLLFGAVLGCATGLSLGASKAASRAVMPIMTGLNGLPKLALGPLIIIWFGIGISSKVIISGVMVYFVFVFNLYAGYQNVDSELMNGVRLLGGTRKQIIRKVVWPSCLPWFLASLRAGLGLSLAGAVVGEYLGSGKGLGWLISDASGRYDITLVLCCVFLIVILMVILDGVVRLLERVLLKWRPEKRG